MKILKKLTSLSKQYRVPTSWCGGIIISFHSLGSKTFFRQYFPLKDFNDIPDLFEQSWVGVGVGG